MSFARILRSSALMGGAQVVVLAAGFVRSKVVALTVGVSGVGLVGVFSVFTTSIERIGEWFGIPKPSLPSESADMATWIDRCRTDCWLHHG